MDTRTTMPSRDRMAAEIFLRRKGYRILDNAPESDVFDFVAWDGKEEALRLIVFDSNRLQTPDEPACFPTENIDREALERAAIELYAASDFPPGRWHVDVLSVCLVNEDRALLRYHLNVL